MGISDGEGRRGHQQRNPEDAERGHGSFPTAAHDSVPVASGGARRRALIIFKLWRCSDSRRVRPVTEVGASGSGRARQCGAGRHRHRPDRAVRLRGDVSGGARPRPERLLGVRRVLGGVRSGHRRRQRPAAGGHPRGPLDALRQRSAAAPIPDGPRTHPLRVASWSASPRPS